jgi:hypothetical protein
MGLPVGENFWPTENKNPLVDVDPFPKTKRGFGLFYP